MTSFGYCFNPRYAIKECSSCGTLYTRDCVCSIGTVEDKILVPKPPKNCARCTRYGYLVDGPHCQGRALLRQEFEKILVTHSPDFQNTSEPSNASTNIVNAPREPYVVKQDNGSFVDEIIFDLNRAPDLPNQFHCFHCKDVLRDGEACKRCTCAKCGSGLGKGFCYICVHNQNSLNDSPRISETYSQSPPNINHCCYECGDPLDGIFCKRCTCKFCGKHAHICYNCPSKVSVISIPEPCNNQTIDELPQALPIFHPTFHSEAESPFTLDSTPTYVDESPNVFNPPPQPPVYPCEFCENDAYFVTIVHLKLRLSIRSRVTIKTLLSRKIFKMFRHNILVVKIPGSKKKSGEEQAAKAQSWKFPFCYDDEEGYNSLNDNIISELPSYFAVTPTEPIDSLSMGDDHNVLFDDDYDSDSSDDQSLSDEDVREKIYSNPLFDEEIIPMEIDQHSFNVESDLIEFMPNHDSSIIISSKIDFLFDEFAGELTLLKSFPPGIDETNCHSKKEIRFAKRLLYDNSSPRPPERIEEEQTAKAQNWKFPVCYDDDDDEESSNSLNNNIIFELPSYSAVTPTEPIDSLIMEDKHLDTIPATESNEFIKFCVENLVPNPSESKGENGCDVHDGFTTFSNALFDDDYDFDSSDDHIPKKESDEFIKSSVENLIPNPSESKDERECDVPFVGELILLKSIPPGIDEVDCDLEEEIRLIEKLLYDNSSPRPPKEINSETFDVVIKSFSPSPIPVEDSNSLMEEIDLSLTSDDSMPPGIENDDYDSEGDILILEELLSNDSLSLPENESFYFDIPSSPCPPVKPPDDDVTEPNLGISNVKVVGDISEDYVLMPRLLPTQPTLFFKSGEISLTLISSGL
nr:hypothetical protein [Tanacetum cinerariifolium]